MTLLIKFHKCLGTLTRFQALFALALFMSGPLAAQKLATLEVASDAKGTVAGLPVSVNLDDITHLPDSVLALAKVQGRERKPVSFQIEHGPHGRRLIWLTDQDNNARYELLAGGKRIAQPPLIRAKKDNGKLTLTADNKDLLSYQFETMLPPEGINEVFKRSGFIHPLRSPQGKVLTRVQPPDHYHHYGLWNPWTHVLFDGDTIDFWNLNAKQGTVRFSDFVSVVEGPVYGEYAAIHDHIAFTGGREKLAIREVQTVRVYALASAGYYVADITVSMNCPEQPVRLLEYRYGGMGWRATEQWTKENSRVLTSEGKTRKDADGSTARWCIVDGTIDGGNAGVVIMSYPSNYNHPEPLRIWPENANRNRGDMFANFSPTKNMDWQLKPGKNYVLKYRFIVFDGEFDKSKAEAAWQHFATPPRVKVVKN